MSHVYSQFRYQRIIGKKIVDIFLDVTFGASGAPTPVAKKNNGVSSISRTSAGLFVITLDDAYQRILTFDATPIVAAASFPAAPNVQLCAQSTTGSAPTITIQFANAANTTATDPANGEEWLLDFSLLR